MIIPPIFRMNSKRSVLSLTKKFALQNHNLYNTINPRVSSYLNKINNFITFQMDNKDNIVWIDMELTGLDIENDKILEVACLVTTEKLEIISPTFRTIVHQPDDILERMNDWNKNNHAKTGLINDVKISNVDIKEAESQLLNFLKPFTVKGSCPLGGNTVWMDRIYLRKHMSAVDNYLNYRIIDVSSIKELCKRWSPNIFRQVPEKRLIHRAIEDIEDSIEELRYYRKNFFKLTN